MRELKEMIAKEQPLIDDALRGFVQGLPEIVRPVADHILFAGGKRLRPLLCLLCGRLCGLHHTDLYTLGAAVEMLHAATLLHDDILDNSPIRRSVPAAHTVFGTARVVLAGDALLARALLAVAKMGQAPLTACIAEAVMQTAAGEVAEIESTRDLGITQQAYLTIITGKTAWMLRAACELGALRAGVSEQQVAAAAEFGLALGIAFQIVDDVLDFSPAEQTGKPRGGDIREGKVTPPLLFYLAGLPEKERAVVAERFCTTELTQEEIDAMCQAVYNNGYCQKALELCHGFLGKALVALDQLPNGEEKTILTQMAQHVRTRGC